MSRLRETAANQPTAVLLAGLTLVAFALRLPSFSDSLWADELSTNYVVNGFGVGSVLHIVLSDQEGTPPLFFFLTWVTKAFDDAEGLRLVSLLAGLGAIPLTYVLGARTVGQGPALVAATLVALSPFQIFYSTEARAYELVMFFCLLSAVLLLVALEAHRAGWWVALAFSVAAAAYTHYTSVFVLLALFGWAFVFRPTARRSLLLSGLGAVVLYIPWVPELLDDRHEPAAMAISLLHPLTLQSAEDDIAHWSLAHPFIPISQVPGHLAVGLMAVAAAVGSIGIVLRWRLHSSDRWWPAREGLVLVVLLAVAAPVGEVVEHFLGPNVFSARNIISSWPGLALLAGTLVAAGRSPWRVAASCLLVGAFAIGGIKMLNDDYQRPDYDAAARYIEQSGPPGSPVLDTLVLTPGAQTSAEAAFAPKGQAAPAGRKVLELDFPTLEERLLIRRQGKSIIAPEPKPTPQRLAREAAQAAGPSGTIFVITGGASLEYLRGLSPPLADFLNNLPPSFHLVAYRDFPGLAYSGIRVDALRASPAPARAPLKPRT